MNHKFPLVLVVFTVLFSLQPAFAIDFYENFNGPNDQNYDVGWDDNWMIDAPGGATRWTGISYADIQNNQGRHYFTGYPSVARVYLDTDANWVDLTDVGDIETVQLNFISMTEVGATTGGYFQFRVGTDANQGMVFSFLHGEGDHAASTGIWFGSNDPVVSNDPKGHVVRAVLEKTSDTVVNVEVFYDNVSQASRDVPIGSNIFKTALGDVFQIRIEGYAQDGSAGWDVRWDDLNVLASAGVDSNFSWARNTTLDPENAVNVSNYTLTDTSTVSGAAVIQDYNWMIDGNLIATTQNLTVDLNGPTEYHVCHGAHATEGATHYHEIQCYDFRVPQYPQGVSFTVIPAQPGSDNDVNIDIAYTDNNAMSSFSAGWSDANYFSDFNNLIVQFDNSGTQQVCVTAADVEDLNKSYCANVIVYGHLKMHFMDENTGINLQPQVLINDANYSDRVDVNGLLSVDLNTSWATGTYTIRAYDNNGYSSRYWKLDLNSNSDIDYNVTLLRTTVGTPIDFKFYDPDLGILANAEVRVNIKDANIASIRKTDASGQVQLFLNPNDTNYTFQITTSDKGTTYTYAVHTLTVKIPKDEKTVANITPFDVYVAGIGAQSYTNLSDNINVFIFSNTADYYLIDVNSAGYYPRRYLQKKQGASDASTLQPYLVTAADGILPIFYIKDNLSGAGLPDIRVVAEKFIAGEGLVEVQSDVSDIAGTVAFNFWANDTYYLSFYTDGTALWEDALIQPISGTYHFYVGTQAYTVISANPPIIDINFSPTTYYVLAHGDSNSVVDINVGINVTNGTISTYNIHVTADANVLYDYNGTALGTYNIPDLNIAGQGNAAQIVVAVTITLTTGEVYLKRATYSIKTTIDFAIPDVYTMLTTILPAELNTGENSERLLVTTFIALMASLVAVGIAAKKASTDYTALTIIFLAVMGLFTMLGWVIIELYALMLLLGIVLAIISRRL